MALVFKFGTVEIWRIMESYGEEFLVYGVTQSGDPVTCPSIGMAHEVAATASPPL